LEKVEPFSEFLVFVFIYNLYLNKFKVDFNNKFIPNFTSSAWRSRASCCGVRAPAMGVGPGPLPAPIGICCGGGGGGGPPAFQCCCCCWWWCWGGGCWRWKCPGPGLKGGGPPTSPPTIGGPLGWRFGLGKKNSE
jgi:hypothetical protein